MEYEKIHECPSVCILYWKEFMMQVYVPCVRLQDGRKTQREMIKKEYQQKCYGIFHRFRDLNVYFGKKSLIWHDEERIKDKLRRPANSLDWEQVNKMWSKIGDDPRNLCLGLSADGINPHSLLSSKYSYWPIILAIYNLPPWLCMKYKFTMLNY